VPNVLKKYTKSACIYIKKKGHKCSKKIKKTAYKVFLKKRNKKIIILLIIMEEYKFMCKECNFKCLKRGDYNRHIKTKKHLKIISDGVRYKCKICEKVFLNRSGLWRHKKVCNKKLDNEEYKELYYELLREQNKLKDEITRVYQELIKKQTENDEIMKQLMHNMTSCAIIQQI